MEAISSIRIASTNDATVHKLHEATMDYFEKVGQGDKSSSLTKVNNKYFKAIIALDRSCSEAAERKEAVEEGLILAFDAADFSDSCTNFNRLAPLHIENDSHQLRMCVALKNYEDCENVQISSSERQIPSTKEEEEEYSRRVLWCLDHGYEYVEADITSKGREEGHDTRDKEGFARIVEAIRNTMWSTATMHPRHEVRSAATSPDKSNAVPSENISKTHVLDTASKVDKVSKSANSVVPTQKSDSSPTKADIDLVEEEETQIDNLESILKECARISDAAKSGKVSDEERRKNASEVAMKLMNALGGFGSDESSDEEV